MPSYNQVAESYINDVLPSIQPHLHQSVTKAIFGGDEDLLLLLQELPNSPVCLLTIQIPSYNILFLSNQGLNTLMGQQLLVWIYECKLEIVLLQHGRGYTVNEEKLKSWIVS
jgi:hypothetical protein